MVAGGTIVAALKVYIGSGQSLTIGIQHTAADAGLGRHFGVALIKIVPHLAMDGGAIHQKSGHGQDGIVVAVGIDGLAEKGFRALVHLLQPKGGDELARIGFGVRECEYLAPQVFQVLQAAVAVHDQV